MGDDAPLKSAYELAMERLRANDREEGTAEKKPLDPEQKQRIAELRATARAKLAELEILHRDQRAAARGDAEKIAQLDERYEIDRRRVESRLESDIAAVHESRD